MTKHEAAEGLVQVAADNSSQVRVADIRATKVSFVQVRGRWWIGGIVEPRTSSARLELDPINVIAWRDADGRRWHLLDLGTAFPGAREGRFVVDDPGYEHFRRVPRALVEAMQRTGAINTLD